VRLQVVAQQKSRVHRLPFPFPPFLLFPASESRFLAGFGCGASGLVSAEVGGYIIDMSEKRHDEVIEYQIEFWRITRLVNQQSDEKIVLFSVRPA
jgi:hypothetical protein